MRYRYIASGDACSTSNKPISNFRLISACCFEKESRINRWLRLEIPKDLILSSCRGDGYSTTEDNRPLSSFVCAAIVRIDGSWFKEDSLLPIQRNEWYDVIREWGLRPTVDKGWLSEEKYAEYINSRRLSECGAIK